MRFVDTNVLLYSISRDTTEARKREIAIELLDADDLALSVQVLQEFYVQATRATRQDAISHEIAARLIRTWRRFSLQEVTFEMMLSALDIKARHGLAYWDAAIVAAAKLLGCVELLSEDLQHGRKIDGVMIHNLFHPGS